MYGRVTLKIPENLTTDAPKWWNFSILSKDDEIIDLNLKLTDGILLDESTPTWSATGSGSKKVKVTYEKVSVSKIEQIVRQINCTEKLS